MPTYKKIPDADLADKLAELTAAGEVLVGDPQPDPTNDPTINRGGLWTVTTRRPRPAKRGDRGDVERRTVKKTTAEKRYAAGGDK